MGHLLLLFLSVLLLVSPKAHASWSWFSSSSSSTEKTRNNDYSSTRNAVSDGYNAEFSIKGVHNEKGNQLVEDARRKLVGSNTCWQNAYRYLLSGCSNIIATEDKRSRFAWHLSDCFQKDSGRSPFPSCGLKSAMVTCLKKLDDQEHKVYLSFLLETNTICYQLQAHAFHYETERLVNDLKNTGESTLHKLETIDEKSDHMVENSNQIHDAINQIDYGVQNLSVRAKDVQENINVLSKHSQAVYEQSIEIASSQSELQQGQERMKEKLAEGMAMLRDAYSNLGEEVDSLRREALEIEIKITKVGDAMFSRMENLQKKADDIGSMTGVSLDKQKELLDGQSTAVEGIHFLTKFQSEALEESRKSLERLVEYGHKQQEELLKRQEQIQKAHDHLVESSRSILAAQVAFESKQASMFIALDKLFALHNSLLLESRIIKAFLVYLMFIFVIYMFTSTKQTYTVRPRLYIGLCVTLSIEVAILRLTGMDIEQQTWIISLIRSTFALLAAFQLLHAVFTYRDYERLNHHMLQTLMEKVNGMQRNKELTWEEMEEDDDVDWSTWVDTDLPEEDGFEDPNYTFPEGTGENSVTTLSFSRKYDLRSRNR